MTERPYELPAGWRWVQLGEVLEKPQYGYTTSASQEFVGPKFVRVTDIVEGRVNWDSVPCCRATNAAMQRYGLSPGDVLIARSGSVGRAALVDRVPQDSIFASYLIRLRAKSGLLPKYLIWFFQSPYYWRQVEPRGAAQVNINAKMIQQFVMPLAPADDQRRIVARVEMLMERIQEGKRLRQQAKEETERLWQSILADAFPKPGAELPAGWRWVRLGEVATVIMGQSPPSDTYNKIGEGLPFFQGKADFGDLYPTPRVWCSEPAKIANEGSVLISVRAPVGPTNIASTQCCIGRGLASLDPMRVLDRWWLLYYLRSIEGTLAKSGSGSTFGAITKGGLVSLLIPLPSVEEQQAIVVRLSEAHQDIDELKAAQEQTETRLKALEQSILDKAFRGGL